MRKLIILIFLIYNLLLNSYADSREGRWINEVGLPFSSVVGTILLFVVILYFLKKKEDSDNRDEESSDSHWSNQNKEINLDKKIVICPNCKKKYSVPTNKYIEINCKDCLYKWKEIT